MKPFTVEEVAKHNTVNDCWVIVDGKVFDLTKFVNDHPGGKKVLAKKAGKDATKEFKTFHNDAIMQRVGLPMQIGVIGSAEKVEEKKVEEKKPVKDVKKMDMRQLVSNQDAKFGEGMPYGDPTWYQDWNR
jgi:cytochrome b involved in lipid metabolism